MLFLSTLSTISEEELEQLRPSLLPHKVITENSTHLPGGGPISSVSSCNPDREIFSAYTTLEDDVASTDDRTNIPDSMEDVDGNISMFLDPSRPSISNGDQIEVYHEDLGASEMQQLPVHDNSESGDIISVISTPERDATTQIQLSNDSEGLDRDTSSSQSIDSNSSDDQVGRNLAFVGHSQTKRNHSLAFSQSRNGIKRVRRAPDITDTSHTSIAVNTNAQRRSESSIPTESPETASPPHTASHYVRSFETLTSKYGEGTDFKLRPTQIIEVIRAGDSFIREDSVDFVTSYLRAYHDGLWNTPIPCSPRSDSPIENLFKNLHCADILDQRNIVDPLRLRVVRILLFWYFEQLRSNPELLSRCSRGRNTSCIATDDLVDKIFDAQKTQHDDTQDWQRRRNLLQKHKQIGKKWSILIGGIGLGFILICNPDLGSQM
jgi:hypothetical protein